ncbi:MAG: hypothetical protein QM688_12890, partial [Sphingomonas bacterium]
SPAPVAATIHSLDAARRKRAATAPRRAIRSGWAMSGAIAASLVVGVLAGRNIGGPAGIADNARALALSRPIASALDRQLSGEAGAVRVALSFRDREGDLCRSFTASHLSGVACRADDGWRLRYGAPVAAQGGDYRMAGSDAGQMRFVQSIIEGEPLDQAGEAAARAKQWAR